MYNQIIEVPDFIDRIKLSEHRRAKYYKYSENIPKKYSGERYKYIKNILVDTETGEKIIKNKRTVGTPNILLITGQYYWQGAHPHIRRKMKRVMADYFCNFLHNLPVIKDEDYPIGISIDLYDSMDGGTRQDLDNFIFLYRKVIHDVLVDKEKLCTKIIVDDSKEYVQEINSRFYPIENHEDRKLVIKLYSL